MGDVQGVKNEIKLMATNLKKFHSSPQFMATNQMFSLRRHQFYFILKHPVRRHNLWRRTGCLKKRKFLALIYNFSQWKVNKLAAFVGKGDKKMKYNPQDFRPYMNLGLSWVSPTGEGQGLLTYNTP